MTLKEHRYPLSFSLYHSFFAIVLSSLILLLLYGAISTIRGVDLALLLAFVNLTILLFFLTILLTVFLTTYSLRVRPFHPTRDLLHSNRRWFGIDSSHESYMVSAAGLGRLFWLNGLLYGMGRPTFCISPFINDYHGLMQTLRQKRPDLFYT
jgi:hypothetical protein